MLLSTAVDADCSLRLPNHLPAIHVSRLPSELDRMYIERAVTEKTRELIEMTRARYSSHCLQLTLRYESPREIRVNTLIEAKEAILISESGEPFVGPPLIKPPRSGYQTEQSVKLAVSKILEELSRARDEINRRKTGWAHIYAHFGDLRLTGIRLAIDTKV